MKYVGTTSLAQLITLMKSALAAKANTSHTHSAATTSANGLMAAADKVKLNGVATGANTVKSTATATLTVAGWTGSEAPFTQTVNVSGVTASNIVIISPAPADAADYGAAGCYCSAQGSGTLTFECDTKPDGALAVNVLKLN